MKNCTNCKFTIYQDVGYSNYTVEGTEFMCAKQLHPDGIFDRFYEKDERLNYGEKCGGHVHGAPITMDVEHEDVEILTSEQLEVWTMNRFFTKQI